MVLKAIIGYVALGILSNFLLLYVICFSHVANSRMSRDWARSSALTLFLDLFVLEITPALVVATLALMRGYCCRCKGQICLIVSIELYRLYRNLMDA